MTGEVNNIDDLSKLVRAGFTDWGSIGDVCVKEKNGLLLFNYTPQAQFANRWNAFELMGRGLIVSKYTGEIVARPFDKFFNWGEGNRVSNAGIVSATKKLDGSLGILYWDEGEYKIATRGSFDGEQAIWATNFLKRYDLTHLNYNLTLLFEIIYPDNRVVVDYGNEEALYLLAMRNRFTGEYATRKQVLGAGELCGFPVVDAYDFTDTNAVLDFLPQLSANEEGFVLEFSDGQRFKFKGDKYKELHRLISSLSFKNTLDAVQSNTVDTIRGRIPDEFLDEFNGWVTEINTKVADIKERVATAMERAPRDNRKTFALWVKDNCHDLSSYMFAALDGREIEPLIFRQAF